MTDKMTAFTSSVVTDLLDRESVQYKVLHHSGIAKTIEEAASQRGVAPDQMVKSILLRDMSGFHVLACLPGSASVDPKKVRAVFGCKRMTCADSSQVKSVTGFSPGTVTPVALKTWLPVVFDNALESNKKVNISSGTQLAGLELEFNDLVTLCNPMFADISR